MEDAHITMTNFDKDISLFAVFDGHGGIASLHNLGQAVALFAQRNFPPLLKTSKAYKEKNYKQALIDVFMEVDRKLGSEEGREELIKIYSEIKGKLLANRSISGGSLELDKIADTTGCTACVALITKTEIYVANAGDSRCVLAKNGIAINMSEDHKPELEFERIRIEKAGGFVEENRINSVISLSRALGDLEFKRNKKYKVNEQMIISIPEVRKQKLTNECDFMILACDGIWDCLGSQNAVDFVVDKLDNDVDRDPAYLSSIASDMMDSILAVALDEDDGLGCDNMTCIVICFNKIN